MPALDQQAGPFSTALAAALFLGLLAISGLIWLPLVILLPVFLCFKVIPETRSTKRREARVATARHGESICDFARSFDCRVVDTWIIRAVHAEISSYCGFPLRSSDLLIEDLHIDPEDLEDCVGDIAERVGLSLERAEENPMWSRVCSVSDLVAFFQHLPRVVSHASLAIPHRLRYGGGGGRQFSEGLP